MDRPGVAPPFIDQEVPNRLFQIGAETALLAIGVHEQPPGEHDGLEETLGQIVCVVRISRDARR